MKMPSRPTLTIAAALAALAIATPAWAQQDSNKLPPEVRETVHTDKFGEKRDQNEKRGERGTKYRSMREQRDAALAKQKGERGAQKTEAQEAQYPLATREEPDAKPSRSGVKKLQALQESYQNGEAAATIAAAVALANDPESNSYEQSFAWQIAGSAAANEGNEAASVEYFTKALAADSLDNNNHYTVMFNLAVQQYGLDKYEDALKTVDRFIAETKSDKVEAQNLRGGALVGLERYADAAKLYSELLAAHPDNQALRMNAVAAYQQAEQPDKAVALLADALANGQLTGANEYRALYVSYINAKRNKDAVAVIDDGVAKGIIKPGPELARDYMVLGQEAYYASDLATAAEMYERAASMAADGEASLNLAKIHAETGNKAASRAAAQRALEKGVKETAEAKRLAGSK